MKKPPARRFLPGNKGLAGALVGVGWAGLMGLVGLGMLFDPDSHGAGTSLGALGLAGFLLGSAPVLVGAALERDPPPRAALAWGVVGLLLAGWITSGLGVLADGGDEVFDVAMGLSCFFAPLVMVAAVPAGLFTRTALATLGREARADRLAAALAAVALRGRVGLDELASELHVPMDLLRTELAQAIQDRHFTGHVNWADGTLYSEQATKLQDAGRCPSCNGAMALAGHRVIQCPHCETEVFL